MRRYADAVASWPLWTLPRWLVGYIITVALVYLMALAIAGRVLAHVRPGELLLFGLLTLGSLATVEMTRRGGENAGVIKDMFAVWELPIAILLPPIFALLSPLPRMVMTQLRVRQVPHHRRAFTTAAIGLSYGIASVVFHAVIDGDPMAAGVLGRSGWWICAVALAGVLQWAVNQVLVLSAIRGADPTARVRDLVLNREMLQNDFIELSAAVLATVAVGFSSIAIVLILPLVAVLQRSSRHAQLVNESRIDSKTSLLNAGTWNNEAGSEVMRAQRTGTQLTVALIDIDQFKGINDTYGHLAGDRTLLMVADSLRMMLRGYDLAGRFGGDELAVLLPQTGPREAAQVLDRIRRHIAATPMLVDAALPDEGTFRCTISVGAAALSGRSATLTELLAAADSALYRAKQAGRDHVRVVSGPELDDRRSAVRQEHAAVS